MGVTTYTHVTKGMGGKHEMRAGLMLNPDNLGGCSKRPDFQTLGRYKDKETYPSQFDTPQSDWSSCSTYSEYACLR